MANETRNSRTTNDRKITLVPMYSIVFKIPRIYASDCNQLCPCSTRIVLATTMCFTENKCRKLTLHWEESIYVGEITNKMDRRRKFSK